VVPTQPSTPLRGTDPQLLRSPDSLGHHPPPSAAPGGRVSLGDDFDRTLRGARRGRQRAWDELYRDLAPPLLGYLRAQRAPDPEDVVGEVFVEVVRSLSRFEGDEAGFRSWVFTIAHRRMIDARRAAGRRPAVPTPHEDLEPSLPAVAGEAMALESASTHEVLTLLDRLGEEQREVLVLRIIAGLTTREIAEVTGRDPEAVKGLAKRGLTRLRVLLGVGASGTDAPRGPGEDAHGTGVQQADGPAPGSNSPPPDRPDRR
jgi:RNA polymerase sigma factor (sigma-70 family)